MSVNFNKSFKSESKSLKYKEELDSSLDSSNSDKIETKTNLIYLYTQDEINKEVKIIKEKLTKSHLNNSFFEKEEFVDWMKIYGDFFTGVLIKNQIDSKQIELRINSALNKYDEKRDRIIKHDSIQNLNYKQNNKEKYFISSIINKYNKFGNDEVKTVKKNHSPKHRNVFNTNNLFKNSKPESKKNATSGFKKVQESNKNLVLNSNSLKSKFSKSKTIAIIDDQNKFQNLNNGNTDDSLNFEFKQEINTTQDNRKINKIIKIII